MALRSSTHQELCYIFKMALISLYQNLVPFSNKEVEFEARRVDLYRYCMVIIKQVRESALKIALVANRSIIQTLKKFTLSIWF